MTKNLVSSGAEFIGSHFIDAFLFKGYETLIVHHLFSGSESNLYPKAKLYKIDIRGLNADKAKRDFGCALILSLEDGLRETVEYFKTSEKAI